MANENDSAGDVYDGPVCYVGEAQAHTIDGEIADSGWHYTAVVDSERKQLAVDHAKAEVALWKKRASKPLIGTFAKEQLEIAEASLKSIEDASWEVPGEKLTLDKDGTYHYATEGAKSHHEKHHKRYTLLALGGNIGIPETPEQVESALRHLDELEQRLSESGLDAHESDHIYTTPDEIAHLRRYLKQNPMGVRR